MVVFGSRQLLVFVDTAEVTAVHKESQIPAACGGVRAKRHGFLPKEDLMKSSNFSYTDSGLPSGLPSVSTVDPAVFDARVTITGSNFGGPDLSVTVGGVACTVASNTDDMCDFVSSPGWTATISGRGLVGQDVISIGTNVATLQHCG